MAVPAAVAFAVVHADDVAAFWATVSFSLALEERVHAFSFQLLEVFNHAHPIAGAVTLVQMHQLLTRHHGAFAAGLDFAMRQLLGFAASLDIAVLGSGTAPSAVSDFAPLPRHPMRVGEISFADSAIHPARSNKVRGEFASCHVFQLEASA